MPFDPNLPQANTEIDAVQMRAQLNGLNDLISAKPSVGEVVNAVNQGLQGSSNNSNAVGQMSLSADGSYNALQLQQVMDTLDELILALRR
jgi:hypothetical protein